MLARETLRASKLSLPAWSSGILPPASHREAGLQSTSPACKREATGRHAQHCGPPDKWASLGLLRTKTQKERGEGSEDPNAETVEPGDTEAQSRLQQMEEGEDEKNKRCLPCPALAGPCNASLRPLRISSKENVQYHCKTGEKIALPSLCIHRVREKATRKHAKRLLQFASTR